MIHKANRKNRNSKRIKNGGLLKSAYNCILLLLFFSRLGLIIKLSVVMGITFIFEIVSSFYDFHPSKLSSLGVTNALTWIEIILDSINCCQGIIETC